MYKFCLFLFCIVLFSDFLAMENPNLDYVTENAELQEIIIQLSNRVRELSEACESEESDFRRENDELIRLRKLARSNNFTQLGDIYSDLNNFDTINESTLHEDIKLALLACYLLNGPDKTGVTTLDRLIKNHQFSPVFFLIWLIPTEKLKQADKKGKTSLYYAIAECIKLGDVNINFDLNERNIENIMAFLVARGLC